MAAAAPTTAAPAATTLPSPASAPLSATAAAAVAQAAAAATTATATVTEMTTTTTTRAIASIALVARDISIVDRTSLSLWHFQQLCRQLLPAPRSGSSGGALDGEDKENIPMAPSDATTTTATAANANTNTNANANATTNAATSTALPTTPAMAPLPSLELEEGMRIAAMAWEPPPPSSPVEDPTLNATSPPAPPPLTVSTTSEGGDGAHVTMATTVAVVYRRYRCVLCLDASPSTRSVDPTSGKVFLDLLYQSVELFLRALLRPMTIGARPFVPEVHLSVIVQGAQVESLCVLIQGFVLDPSNLPWLLQLIRERLQLIEDDWASRADVAGFGGDAVLDEDAGSIFASLQNAVFALNSLPGEAAPNLVLATDGVVGLRNAYAYDGLVMQLVRHDVRCHFLQIGGGNDVDASFGYVPDLELLRFLADATDGCVVDHDELDRACFGAPPDDPLMSLTTLQRGIFVRESSIHGLSKPVVKLNEQLCSTFDGTHYVPLRPYRMWRQKIHEYRIHADVDRIVEARVREGFVVNKLHLRWYHRSDDGTLLKIHSTTASSSSDVHTLADVVEQVAATKMLIVFLIQWKQDVWLEYVVSSTIDHGSRKQGGPRSKSKASIDSTSGEWYVKINVLASGDFLRFLDDSQARAVENHAPPTRNPTSLHGFVRSVQDVDRVLLHLMTASASAASAVEASSHLSFSGINSVQATTKTQQSHPVFGIIGELSPVLWHRWFHVDRFEILFVVCEESCTEDFYRSPLLSRASVQYRAATRGGRRISGGVEAFGAQATMGVNKSIDHLRSALLQWSSQKLSKDLYLKFLGIGQDAHHRDSRGSSSGISATATTPSAGHVAGKRRQRSSVNSAMITAQLSGGHNIRQSEIPKGALCFVRLEIKNKTLVAIHVAFFSCSSALRKTTLAELKATLMAGLNDPIEGAAHSNKVSQVPQWKNAVLCHRMLSRLLVTHETLLMEDSFSDGAQGLADGNPGDGALVTCCGGSELRLRSVFGAYMWHASWKWRFRSSDSLLLVMQHLHEIRIRTGYWVVDWQLEEELASYRVASVIFGREIVMEDERGRKKTSFIQYALRRISDTTLMTSFWMEPQYGFVGRQIVDPEPPREGQLHWGLPFGVGHGHPMHDSSFIVDDDESLCVNAHPLSSGGQASGTYLGEGELLHLIRDHIFNSDRHLLSCLHTFETILDIREPGDMMTSSGKFQADSHPVGSVSDEELRAADSERSLVPAFSTARLLSSSKRSTEHFLMYLETNGAEDVHSTSPELSSANMHLYSMLERTLRGLSDCEIAWTDELGKVVSTDASAITNDIDVPQAAQYQLPSWLNRSMRSAYSSTTTRQLSQGKCFAKLLSEETVILAFLPAIKQLKKQRKRSSPTPGDFNSQRMTSLSPKSINRRTQWSTSAKAKMPAATTPSVMRMTVSADDIVLYQERRSSFREGYKSWRMGHYHGAKDDKSFRLGTSQLASNSRNVSTSEDLEFCASICRQAELGCDVHLLLEKADGTMCSSFFQVAFYECSLNRLSSALTSNSAMNGNNQDQVHTEVFQQLFPNRAPQPHSMASLGLAKRLSAQAYRHQTGRLHSSTATNPTNPSPEQSILVAAHRFQKQVKRAHEHNFSRGVYLALRDGASVQQSDLIQALSSCVEVPVDVDITMLHRILELEAVQGDGGNAIGKPSAFDLFSGDSLREVVKEQLDKSLEKIFVKMFDSVAGSRYYYFKGSEVIAFDEVLDNDNDIEPLLVDDEDIAALETAVVDTKPPSLVKSVTIATEFRAHDISTLSEHPAESDDEMSNTVDAISNDADEVPAAEDEVTGAVSPDVQVSTDLANEESQTQQDEDAEFNKDVAVATSSFSSPFFFRFECREVDNSHIRQTRGDLALDTNPAPPKRRPLRRSASTKSFMELRTEFGHTGGIPTPAMSSKSAKSELFDSAITEIAESMRSHEAPKYALRMVTLTLPNEQLLERTRRQQLGIADEGQSSTGSTQADLFMSLPFYQRQVLKRLRRSITEWSSMEILRILRSVRHITPAISRLAHSLFGDLPLEYLTAVTYPLHFVTKQQDNMDPLDLFQREFASGEFLTLQQCEDSYFVVRQVQSRSNDEIEIPYWAIFTIDSSSVTLRFHHPPNDEVKRLDILTQLHIGVNSVCRKVNQFLLLLQLHETRSCNELLLPIDPATSNSTANPPSPSFRREPSGSVDWSEGTSTGLSRPFFWPGQFECDLKYAAFFKLNERMVPNIALSMLCTSALEQFQVHNRRHVFVYRDRGGHVFYMKMRLSSNQVPTTKTAGRRVSENVRNMDMSAPYSAGTLGSNTNQGLPHQTGILLEVFGVCEAGEEVTQELCRLLERKLDDAMQLILMKLLARNTKFQLNASDWAFVCPPGSQAVHTVAYRVPGQIPDCNFGGAVIPFLCQSLGTSSFVRQSSTLPASESIRSVPRLYPPEERRATKPPTAPNSSIIHPAAFSLKGAKSDAVPAINPEVISPVCFASYVDDVENKCNDQAGEGIRAVDDAAFVVNLNPELRLSPGFLSRVGKGLALLRVHVFRVQESVQPEALSDTISVSQTDIRQIKLPDNTNQWLEEKCKEYLLLRYQLWTRGAINCHELSDTLDCYLKEALFDCCIECALRSISNTGDPPSSPTALPSGIETVVGLLNESSKTSSSSAVKLEYSGPLPPWDLSNIAIQFTQFFRSVPQSFRPLTFTSPTANSRVFAKLSSDPKETDGNHRYLLVPCLDVARGSLSSGPSSSSLIHSDSVVSELSDIDALSGRQSAGSVDSTASSFVSSAGMKDFGTTDFIFHSSIRPSQQSVDAPFTYQRTAYYVVDISAVGLRVFAYNLSIPFLEALSCHSAKVLTWSLLRSGLLQALLLEKSGAHHQAPDGCSVVQPRTLYDGRTGRINGLGSLASASPKDFSTSFIPFSACLVSIVDCNRVLPKTLDVALFMPIDKTALGRFLRDTGVAVTGIMERTRSQSIASNHHNMAEISRESSGIVRSTHHQDTSRNNVATVETGPLKASKTVPSPTKRNQPASSFMTPNANSSQNSGGLVAASRLRTNVGAANALLAARARARGGMVGKMGGPGVGTNRSAGGGSESVAPWDIPLTTARPAVTSTSRGNSSSDLAVNSHTSALRPNGSNSRLPIRTSSTVNEDTMISVDKRMSGTHAKLSANAGSSRSGSMRATPHVDAWKRALGTMWGPRVLVHHQQWKSNNETSKFDKKRSREAIEVEGEDEKMNDPIGHFGKVFHRVLRHSTGHKQEMSECMQIVRFSKHGEIPESPANILSDSTVRTLMRSGHLMLHQRHRVTFIERWEVVKIDEEYVKDDGSGTTRLQALQASMDLANLLSYKKEFVFTGNDRVIANLLTEHTIQAMCGKEGQAVREMKMQIMKDVFHHRMEVVHRFFELYSQHLRSIGFRHLRHSSSRLQPFTRDSESPSTAVKPVDPIPLQFTVDAVAAEEEEFDEYFLLSQGEESTSTRQSTIDVGPNEIVVLELKCDHSGVQIAAVLLSEHDLRHPPTQSIPHHRPFQLSGERTHNVAKALRSTLHTRTLIHDFTIRVFQDCLLKWSAMQQRSSGDPRPAIPSLHNMVKGIRSFLQVFPQTVPTSPTTRNPHAASNSSSVRECSLSTTTVELPVRNLKSNCSESILVRILLRYIAGHGARYEVADLTQFGTPDTLVCHSSSGSFFNRQAVLPSQRRGPGKHDDTRRRGYSLLVTTQDLYEGQKRPKNSVLLALLCGSPASTGIGNVLLPVERALIEAELFVKEMFRAAAANYERDLLWSRLLHADGRRLAAEVAQTLALPMEHFQVEVGPQQLEECLRLSVCTPLDMIDPNLHELLAIEDVCWQEFALRIRDVYAGQVREYQFEGQAACHFLLLCPDARDLMIHLTFPSGITSSSTPATALTATSADSDGDTNIDVSNRVRVEICRREEPPNQKFTLPQRRAITDFVNSISHWLWRCLLYD